ncbi:MAG: DUF3795 domain-containing protein [Lentihominibacter sp.]
MKKYIGCCGLDCEKCDSYIATINDDDELRAKTAKFWSELNQVEILPEHINCLGCRTDGIKSVFCESICQIRKCALEKGYDTCGDCDKIDTCERLQSFVANVPEALDNLR